ncbi:hypothetical protein EDD18DRAFT_1334670 [Armillaria luteobubalina]|uniref:F-box domain-containing protein n=1 Tax=Armillaria luteobubalina TaxID=153913 RepID=A0AA39TJK5_9AGAR|nr:hypothetical protein EDD18DRAFT_1334670 [Armillaria luteobubalina]
MYTSRRWSLASKSARLVGIPNELQLEILSYLPSCDLLAIITTSRQFLEIIAYILAQRGSMWYLPDCLDINVETSRAAKLWLWSNQGRDLTFIVRLTFTVWLEIAIPAHVVRAIIKHHASLRDLNTIRATIVHDGGDSRYSLQGHKSGIQCLLICPDLASILEMLTFIDIRYVQLVPSVETPLLSSTFLQWMFPTSFPPETAVHLALPLLQKFDYQALREIPPQVAFIKRLYLEFEAFKTVKDVLDALSSCAPFIKGRDLTLQIYGLEKNALDQILLAIHTSCILLDYLLVIVAGRTHDKKVLYGGVNTRAGKKHESLKNHGLGVMSTPPSTLDPARDPRSKTNPLSNDSSSSSSPLDLISYKDIKRIMHTDICALYYLLRPYIHTERTRACNVKIRETVKMSINDGHGEFRVCVCVRAFGAFALNRHACALLGMRGKKRVAAFDAFARRHSRSDYPFPTTMKLPNEECLNYSLEIQFLFKLLRTYIYEKSENKDIDTSTPFFSPLPVPQFSLPQRPRFSCIDAEEPCTHLRKVAT